MHDLLPEPDVFRLVEVSRRESKLLGEMIVRGRLGEAGVDERGQLAIIVSGKCDALFGGRASADREVHTLTREHELERTLHHFRRCDRQRHMRPGVAFATKPAADERTDHAHMVFGEGKLCGEHLLNADDVLRGVVDGQARFVFRPMRQSRVQLNRIVVVWRRAVDVVHFIPR